MKMLVPIVIAVAAIVLLLWWFREPLEDAQTQDTNPDLDFVLRAVRAAMDKTLSMPPHGYSDEGIHMIADLMTIPRKIADV